MSIKDTRPEESSIRLPETGYDPGLLDYSEMGATGLRRFSGFIYDEFLSELTGWKGCAVYKEMSWNDPTIGGILFAIRMLCRRATWYTEPASSNPADVEAADFLTTCMNDMDHTWVDFIDEVTSMLVYGHSVHEIVYKRRAGDAEEPFMRSQYADGRIGWRKLPIRSQDTLYRWDFDQHGDILGVQQLAPPEYRLTSLPVEKMLLFRTRIERNNPQGFSVLRTAYRPWYFKKNIENIEGIGIERDLAGLPTAWVPPELLSPNASGQQRALLASIKKIVTNVRRNSQEGVIFPLQFDKDGHQMFDFKLMSTGGARQFNTTDVINRYDQRIAMSMLADFMLLGSDKAGSYALASIKTNMFSSAIGGFLDIISDIMNRWAIPRLFALNDFDIKEFPEIKHGDVGSVDLAALGAYLQQLSMAGMPLFPNKDVEEYLLDVAGLPKGSAGNTAATAVPVETPPGAQEGHPGTPGAHLAPPSSPSPETPGPGMSHAGV